MVTVAYEGVACVDCLMVIANDDHSGIEDHEDWVSRVLRHDPTDSGRYHVVVAGDEDTEAYFSPFGCDYCGDRLAGDRYPIAFLEA